MSTGEPAPKTPASQRSASPKIDRLGRRTYKISTTNFYCGHFRIILEKDRRYLSCRLSPSMSSSASSRTSSRASPRRPRVSFAAPGAGRRDDRRIGDLERGREERRGKGKCCGVAERGAGEGKRRPDRRVLSSRQALHRVRRISRDRTVREEIYESERSVGWKEAFSFFQRPFVVVPPRTIACAVPGVDK